MRKVSRRLLARTAVAELQAHPSQRPHILQTLAAYLITHKQTSQLALLLHDIATELEVEAGHLYAELSSAFPLDDATRTRVRGYLARQTGARNVELAEQVDPSLLSGMVIRAGGRELDTSARTKLKHLSGLHINTPGGI